MNSCAQNGLRREADNDLHPLVMMYVDHLSGLVGFLSRFIVQKQCHCMNCGYCQDLNEESAMRLCKAILVEARLLVGPLKTIELETEMLSMTREFFEGGKIK